MFARHNRLMGVIYLCADLLLALASFGVATEFRTHLVVRPLYSPAHYPWIILLTVALWMGVAVASGIYRDVDEQDLRRTLGDPFRVGFASTLFLFAVTFAFKLEYISRLLLGLYALTDLFLMIAFRLVARRFGTALRGSVAGFRNFLLVGIATPLVA